jgi:hypothetical protein
MFPVMREHDDLESMDLLKGISNGPTHYDV